VYRTNPSLLRGGLAHSPQQLLWWPRVVHYSKSKFSQTQLIYCQLKWRHVSTHRVIIRPIIEPYVRYVKYKCTFLGKMCTCTWCNHYWTMWHIKYKCTFLGKMCTCTWCDDYWTMFGYIKYKCTILGKMCTCTLCDDYWTMFEVHQVQVHNFGKNVHLYLMWWLLNHVTYIKYKRTFLRKMCTCTWLMITEPCLGTSSTSAQSWEKKCTCTSCDDYWTMFEVHQVQVHNFGKNVRLYFMWWLLNHVWGTSSTSAQFWGKCALVLDVMIIEPCDIYQVQVYIFGRNVHLYLMWWLLNHVWVHQVQAHNFGKNLHLYLMWWLLNQVWGTSSTSAHLGSQNVYNSVRTWVQMKLYLQYYIH